jgi:hypothetical protein
MIGTTMRLSIVAAVTGICLCSCLTARASDPFACSAFNKQGEAATATFVRPTLRLQLTPAGNAKPLALSAVMDDAGLDSCSIFFDSEHRYVAVGVNHLGLKPGPLFVVVADLGTGAFLSNFTVQPSAEAGESLKLVGFLHGDPDLIVLGSGAPDHPAKAFSTTLFHVNGQQANPSATRSLPANALGVGNVSLVDAANDRLWFKNSPQFCPLRSVPLASSGPEGARVDEPGAQAVCDVGSAIGYPDENTLITAVTREPSDLVTRVDLAQHSVEQLALPATGGHGSYTAVGQGILSPDGQVFAVSRDLLSISFLGDGHSHGTEVDVVQVSPLKVIGKVRLKSDTDSASISIDHRNGAVTVLSFENGRWNTEHLKVQ